VLLGDKTPEELGLASVDNLKTKQDKLSVGENLSLIDNTLNLDSTVLCTNRLEQVVEGNIASIILQTGRDVSGNIVRMPLALSDKSETYYFGLLDNNLILTKDNGVSNPTIDSLLITDKNVSNYIPIATTLRNGVVKPDGKTITVDPDGTIHGFDGSAKQDKLIAGTGIQISDDNVISNTLGLTPATNNDLGVVKTDGTTITVNSEGTISANFESMVNLISELQNKINELETRLALVEEKQ
jgi:hypothetical protein